jgi:hypothetical protein
VAPVSQCPARGSSIHTPQQSPGLSKGEYRRPFEPCSDADGEIDTMFRSKLAIWMTSTRNPSGSEWRMLAGASTRSTTKRAQAGWRPLLRSCVLFLVCYNWRVVKR